MKTNLSSCCNAEVKNDIKIKNFICSLHGSQKPIVIPKCPMCCDIASPEVIEKCGREEVGKRIKPFVCDCSDSAENCIRVNHVLDIFESELSTQEKEAYKRGFDEACGFYQKEPFNKDK